MEYFTNKEWNRYFRYSLLMHVAIIFLLFGWNFIFPSKPLFLPPAVQVDVIDLPNFLKNKQNNVDTSLPTKKEAPPVQPQEESNSKSDQMKLAEQPKKMKEAAKSALERIKNELAKKEQKENKKLLEQKVKDLQRFDEKFRGELAGHQINKGSSAAGIVQEAANAYLGKIQDKIRNNWELPPNLQSSNLRASIRLYIDASGSHRFYFLKKSGNEIFDSHVEEAIEKSKPFQPPPVELLRELKNNGIEVLFPL